MTSIERRIKYTLSQLALLIFLAVAAAIGLLGARVIRAGAHSGEKQ